MDSIHCTTVAEPPSTQVCEACKDKKEKKKDPERLPSHAAWSSEKEPNMVFELKVIMSGETSSRPTIRYITIRIILNWYKVGGQPSHQQDVKVEVQCLRGKPSLEVLTIW